MWRLHGCVCLSTLVLSSPSLSLTGLSPLSVVIQSKHPISGQIQSVSSPYTPLSS